MAARRIKAEDARRAVERGEALLVCAYDSDDKCSEFDLEGAIPLSRFRLRQPSLPKDQQVIFY